jgi:hypothetical protein
VVDVFAVLAVGFFALADPPKRARSMLVAPTTWSEQTIDNEQTGQRSPAIIPGIDDI